MWEKASAGSKFTSIVRSMSQNHEPYLLAVELVMPASSNSIPYGIINKLVLLSTSYEYYIYLVIVTMPY